MAPIDLLPLEVVHAIIAFIDTRDLLAVALVSRLFNAIATPKIYESIRYTSTLSQQRGKILCPLELINVRSDLLANLKSLQIDSIPWDGGTPHPGFTQTCLDIVEHAPALTSFSWKRVNYYTTFHDRVRYMIASIRRAPSENSPPPLEALLLKRLGCVKHVSLNELSRGGNRALVEWATSNPRPSLASLTISRNFYLNSTQLDNILANTPNLKVLSITASQHITPSALFPLILPLKIESLDFSIDSSSLKVLTTTFPTLPTLRHILLAVTPPVEMDTGDQDTSQDEPLTQALFLRIFQCIQNVILHSLTFDLRMSRILAPDTIKTLLTSHGGTLRKLNLFGLHISAQSVADLISRVSHLEQLGVQLRRILDELEVIVEALHAAQHLHTIIDTTPRPRRRSKTYPWVQIDAQIEQLLRAGPALRHVVSPQWGDEWVKALD